MTNSRYHGAAPTLRIQQILYGNAAADVEYALSYIARAAENAVNAGRLSAVDIGIGDCSPRPVFDAATIARLAEEYANAGLRRIDYQFFGANLGSAAGQNRLFEGLDHSLVLIQNPDTIAAPDLLLEMLKRIDDPTIGIVESRQVPLEHPKDYDQATGDTSWASTSCAMIALDVVQRVGGFDAETFFLCCADVDYSWRVRLAGYRVVYQPTATIFHDKRLARDGGRIASGAEEYYSAEAALLLAYKYARYDILESIRARFALHGTESQKQALAAFGAREAERRLPPQLDRDRRVATFVAGAYGKHRF